MLEDGDQLSAYQSKYFDRSFGLAESADGAVLRPAFQVLVSLDPKYRRSAQVQVESSTVITSAEGGSLVLPPGAVAYDMHTSVPGSNIHVIV